MTFSADAEQALLEVISDVIGDGPKSNHEPYSSGSMSRYVEKAIESGDFAATGSYIADFEHRLTVLTGAKYAVTTNTGTSALQVLLKCAGVSAGDEVLIPAVSFVATANAVSYLGATPHFLDVTFPYCTIDFHESYSYLSEILDFNNEVVVNKNTGRVVRAIIGVHVFGHANKLDELRDLAKTFGLPLIEDAAGAIGTLYNQEHVGHSNFGGIVSFNGNKTITTGGGGVILTDSEEIAIRARHLSTTAKVSQDFLHDEVGFNFRMPNINAAIGCAQIEELPMLLARQRNLFHKYRNALTSLHGYELLSEPENCASNYWQQTLVFDPAGSIDTDNLITHARSSGITLRKLWWPLPDLIPYKNAPSMNLSQAWKCHANLINLPSTAKLGNRDSN